MCEAGFGDAKSGDAIIRKRGEEMRPSQDFYVNVYVISDLKNPSNNGQVRILRMGKMLHDKYLAATSGDYASVYGDKIWRLGKGGCTFNLTSESAGKNAEGKEYPTYVNSSFLPAEASDGDVAGLTKEKINEICASVYELPALFPTPILSVVQKALDEHYYGDAVTNEENDVEDEEVVMTKQSVPTETTSKPRAKTGTSDPIRRDPNPEPPVLRPSETVAPSVSAPSASASDEELNKLLGI
jgi:hypothetical protein